MIEKHVCSVSKQSIQVRSKNGQVVSKTLDINELDWREPNTVVPCAMVFCFDGG
jgi:hypothetical protein